MSEPIRINRAPCQSCPYRQDVPSGIWSTEEYDKITPYDNETSMQPTRVFMCHQADGCLCRGWLDTHGSELLGLRLAVIKGKIDADSVAKALNETPSVPVFSSASAAAKHGRRSIKRPGRKAREMAAKIGSKRKLARDIQNFEKLASCDQDVLNVMRWWLVQQAPRKYLRMAMAVGGVNEVIQEACLAILNSSRSSIPCHWTTAAINQTRWTLLGMTSKRLRRASKENDFLNMSHDIAYTTSPSDMIAQKELTEIVALCMEKHLQHREISIVKMRMDDMTFDAIAHKMRRTAGRMKQVFDRAILRLTYSEQAAQSLRIFFDSEAS